MTTNELLKETYALGFESEAQLDDAFIFSANRALRRIVTELDCDMTLTVAIPKSSAKLIRDVFTHNPDLPERFSACGKAYSFRTRGEGYYTVSDANGEKRYSFTGSEAVCRGFLSGEAQISFFGEYSYTVEHLTVFDSITSGSVSDISIYERQRKIPLTDYRSDFFRASAPVTNPDGEHVPGAYILGSYLYVPEDFSGELTVKYRRLPRKIGIDGIDEPIDIPPALENLLPLLTASYVWLDDDAEKSQFYGELYREEAARLITSFPRNTDRTFVDVTGWA